MNVQPFTPGQGTTYNQTLAVTNTSGSIALPAAQNVIRVVNAGPQTIFFRFGAGAQTAVTTDVPVLAGTVELFSKGVADTLAAITASATATLYVSVGEGV